MQYLVTAEKMRSCDRNTSEHFGVPSIVLMERAALAAAVHNIQFQDTIADPSWQN